METQNTKNNIFVTLAIPLSIIIAALVIALAVFFSGGSNAGQVAVNQPQVPTAQQPPQQEGDLEAVRPVDAEDHIKGDINAPVKIVEYSDFECPFCKRIHETLNTVVENDSDVAWVYRHFPLEQLHPVKAQRAAVASECVAELGGNDAFWQFTDGYFADTTTGNNRTDQDTLIPELVAEIGIDETAFNECAVSGRYDDHIAADFQNAVDTGGRGTPWSVVIGSDGKVLPLNGAQPQSAIEQIINLLK
jgi:protein-disulfide isomerase